MTSYKEIKSISKDLKIGGPSISQINHMDHWLNYYFHFCIENKCMPDFFTFHFYPHDETREILAKGLECGRHIPRLNPNKDMLEEYVDIILSYVNKYGYSRENVFITEWNSSAFHRELTNDTLYKASYIARTITKNYNKISSLSYWTFSDIIEEFPVPCQTYHGGIGVITKEGIPKAGYYAFYLLNKLGKQLIYSSENLVITSIGDEFQVLMYNYCHFDELYCNNDRSMINELNRYDVFAENEALKITLNLLQLPFYTAKICEYHITKDHGSTFDEWLNMGHPEKLQKEEIEYLKSIYPKYKTSIINLPDKLELRRILKPHEVRLITISKIC